MSEIQLYRIVNDVLPVLLSAPEEALLDVQKTEAAILLELRVAPVDIGKARDLTTKIARTIKILFSIDGDYVPSKVQVHVSSIMPG
jgi:predicted RNA-binding protein YlqC (UPF0109 family)